MDLETLPTPSLVLDVGRVKRNAERVGGRVRELGARLRPHIKTHKCIEVARIQTTGHSGRITVSTLAEASAFAANGALRSYATPLFHGVGFETSPTPFRSSQANSMRELRSPGNANSSV